MAFPHQPVWHFPHQEFPHLTSARVMELQDDLEGLWEASENGEDIMVSAIVEH